MPTKNFVAIAQKICPVCGITHEHNTEILLDKRLQDIPKDKRITGYGLCEEHDKQFKNGFIALVVADESKSKINKKEDGTIDKLTMENAHRTGDIVHMRYNVFTKMFDTKIPKTQEMLFISIDLFNMIKEIQVQNDEEDKTNTNTAIPKNNITE